MRLVKTTTRRTKRTLIRKQDYIIDTDQYENSLTNFLMILIYLEALLSIFQHYTRVSGSLSTSNSTYRSKAAGPCFMFNVFIYVWFSKHTPIQLLIPPGVNDVNNDVTQLPQGRSPFDRIWIS